MGWLVLGALQWCYIFGWLWDPGCNWQQRPWPVAVLWRPFTPTRWQNNTCHCCSYLRDFKRSRSCQVATFKLTLLRLHELPHKPQQYQKGQHLGPATWGRPRLDHVPPCFSTEHRSLGGFFGGLLPPCYPPFDCFKVCMENGAKLPHKMAIKTSLDPRRVSKQTAFAKALSCIDLNFSIRCVSQMICFDLRYICIYYVHIYIYIVIYN